MPVDNANPVKHVRPMSDSTTFKALTAALRERIAVIRDRELYARDPAAHLEKLKTASENIAALQQRLPANIDPQLSHYLTRASYDKALDFLVTAGVAD